jgi:hypothetical protein
MLVLLFNVWGAVVSAESHQSMYSEKAVKLGGRKVTESTHHEADVTQVGSEVMAHEISRKRAREETESGVVRQVHQLQQKAGEKNGHDAATWMREAMGFSKQVPGQPEKGKLDVTEAYNASGTIADVPFRPHKNPKIDTSHWFCHDGHCNAAMDDIDGNGEVYG